LISGGTVLEKRSGATIVIPLLSSAAAAAAAAVAAAVAAALPFRRASELGVSGVLGLGRSTPYFAVTKLRRKVSVA